MDENWLHRHDGLVAALGGAWAGAMRPPCSASWRTTAHEPRRSRKSSRVLVRDPPRAPSQVRSPAANTDTPIMTTPTSAIRILRFAAVIRELPPAMFHCITITIVDVSEIYCTNGFGRGRLGGRLMLGGKT